MFLWSRSCPGRPGEPSPHQPLWFLGKELQSPSLGAAQGPSHSRCLLAAPQQTGKGIRGCLVQRAMKKWRWKNKKLMGKMKWRWKNRQSLCVQFPLGGIHQSPLRALTRAPFITWEVAHLHFEVSLICCSCIQMQVSVSWRFFIVWSCFSYVCPTRKKKSNKRPPSRGWVHWCCPWGGRLWEAKNSRDFFPSSVWYIPNSVFWVFLWKKNPHSCP